MNVELAMTKSIVFFFFGFVVFCFRLFWRLQASASFENDCNNRNKKAGEGKYKKTKGRKHVSEIEICNEWQCVKRKERKKSKKIFVDFRDGEKKDRIASNRGTTGS